MGRIVLLASNYGLWAEELQGPWDALHAAGHELTLATRTGNPPLPHQLSMDAEFLDPMQHVRVTPAEVVERVLSLQSTGAWSSPTKIADVRIDDYDAILMIGGPGAPLDLNGNKRVHELLVAAWQTGKLIGAICYAVGSLVWARQPSDYRKSIIYGKTVAAHPREWDFDFDISYGLVGTTSDNPGTDLVTPGFAYPLRPIVEDAVGPGGRVISPPETTRETPVVVVDRPFVTGLSLESSQAFGRTLVGTLDEWK